MTECNYNIENYPPLSCNERIVAVFGGTFNPIHLGHVSLADNICNSGIVDEVWFMVSPLNPLKLNDSDQILPTDTRLFLTKLALADYPHLKVSDVESKLPVPSYTINTLAKLHEEYPDTQFKLIIGQDNWKNFDSWVEAKKIKGNHDIIVYGRMETVDEKHCFADVVEYRTDGTEHRLNGGAPFHLFDISSTRIREAIRTGNVPFAAKWLEPSVMRYILENALYR